VIHDLAPYLVDNDVEVMELFFMPNTTTTTTTTTTMMRFKYGVEWTPTRAGNYSLELLELYPHGLRGTYFRDGQCKSLLFTRMDERLNFTWTAADEEDGHVELPRVSSSLAIPPFGCVRWQGFLVSTTATALTTLAINTTGSTRLWLDGTLYDIDILYRSDSIIHGDEEEDLVGFRNVSCEEMRSTHNALNVAT
jgi:hypothetical protein